MIALRLAVTPAFNKSVPIKCAVQSRVRFLCNCSVSPIALHSMLQNGCGYGEIQMFTQQNGDVAHPLLNSYVSIPDYKNEKPVLIIGEGTFERNTTLKTVLLPVKLKNINSEAFSGCTSLTTVYFPDSLKSIEESAFNECTKLSKVSLPVGLEVLGSRAFSDCSLLTEIVIPRHCRNYRTVASIAVLPLKA